MFVRGPISKLRDVMSAVPVRDVPATFPWNVISREPIGNWFCPENVTVSLETTPEEIGTWTRPPCGWVNERVPVMASPFWFRVNSAGPCHLFLPPLSLASIEPFQTPETLGSDIHLQPTAGRMTRDTSRHRDRYLSRISVSCCAGIRR